MKAWAICDTDGGKMPPKPLLRHLFESKEEAEWARDYSTSTPQHYPVVQLEITIKGEE